ncbi:MAG: 4'-phosphopantetheinyl transferase superfamily protein [Verrucomicrobia bacterium]|nr:4'-phosphopantetheinyl transferase superfamily protein [Verrucomicrobiota bacterium]
MSEAPATTRCGIDTVEVARMVEFATEHDDLQKLFSATELQEAGQDPGRAGRLAARFAAKEACCKLFPRETALGVIEPACFSCERDPYGAPHIVCDARAQAVLDRHRIAAIRVSLTHTATTASAVAVAELRQTRVPWYGKLVYHLFPYRRKLVLENLNRVFGGCVPADEIRRLAQAYYAHFVLFAKEFALFPFTSMEQKRKVVRVENKESPLGAHRLDRGLLILTGHFGNWEVATTVGIKVFPQYKDWFYFVRRPLKPKLLNDFVTMRMRRSGLGTIAKAGSLDTILDFLGKGAVIVFVYDQHASKKDGIVVDFFGHPASTLKSFAIIAMSTGAPVIPASSWREPDGTHVLRFEDPLQLVDCEDVDEAIRKNTQLFNDALARMLLRHPEQWIWMHRRWKAENPPAKKRKKKKKAARPRAATI